MWGKGDECCAGASADDESEGMDEAVNILFDQFSGSTGLGLVQLKCSGMATYSGSVVAPVRRA